MQTIKQALDTIRDSVNRADEAKGQSQIGHILIAISQLTDVIERMTDEDKPTIRRIDGPFASLRDMRYTECPCGYGSKEVCETQRARVQAHNDSLPF